MDQNFNSLAGQQEPVVYKPTPDERTMAILSHVLTIVAGFIAPLVIYLVKKDESQYVAQHAKESLNFQITVILACLVLILTIVGILFIWIVAILALVFEIIATINASDNKIYRYPLSIRFIK